MDNHSATKKITPAGESFPPAFSDFISAFKCGLPVVAGSVNIRLYRNSCVSFEWQYDKIQYRIRLKK